MKKIYLDSFILIECDLQKEEHLNILNQVNVSQENQNYLGNLTYSIQRMYQRREESPYNIPYIVYFGDDAIGYISLSFINNQYFISYGIVPKYRGQYLGSMLLQEFSFYLWDHYPEIDKLNLNINEKNIASQKTAQRIGYQQENETRYSQKR